jgi:hypothetical protein
MANGVYSDTKLILGGSESPYWKFVLADVPAQVHKDIYTGLCNYGQP